MNYIQETLPINTHKEEIKSFLKNENTKILLITGTTGSGKSTEVPLLSLSCLSPDPDSKTPCIVVSQPRRLAVMELGRYLQSKYQKDIGYKTRFLNRTSSHNKIVILTDGILFRELSELKSITKYDIIIIDEVHERSIATELVLGLLKKHIENGTFKGKLILMSSTVDSKKFETYFKELQIVNIKQRTFDIKKVYINRNYKDINKEVVAFINHYFIHFDVENSKEKIKKNKNLFKKEDDEIINIFITNNNRRGTVLIFLPGIDHITSLHNQILTLGKRIRQNNNTECNLNVYKLHSKTPTHMAKKTLSLLTSSRDLNVVISTNVAETSLTIPNVKYVIDIGLAKKKFFLDKLQLEIIKLMPISKQEAVQREGRCGRTQEGLCVKLYTEKTANELPESTFCSILEEDYSEFLLYIIKNNSLNEFPFLNKLKRSKLKRSLMFLLKLELIDNKGEIANETIVKMLKFPLHPKYMKVLLTFNEKYSYEKEKHESLFFCLVILIVVINEDNVSDFFKNNKTVIKVNEQTEEEKHGDLTKQLLYLIKKPNNNYHVDSKMESRMLNDIEKKLKQILSIYNRIFNCKFNTENVFTFEQSSNLVDIIQNATKLLVSGMFYNIAKKEKGNKYKTLITSMEVSIHSGSALYNKEVEYILFDKLFQNNKVYCRNCEEITEEDIVEYAPNIFRRV